MPERDDVVNRKFGEFDDERREYVVTDPRTPHPWINYLGNSRLTAFISQNAGGLAFFREPQTRRLTRYQWLALPPDRPGFYLYVNDGDTVWNPHFAPSSTRLDHFECRHGLGYTTFVGERDGLRVTVRYSIPPDDDVMLWDVTVTNLSPASRRVQLTSYVEFGLLEFARELFWCYLKNQIRFTYDADLRAIRYDYHVFGAPFSPGIFFACTREIAGFECSREAFTGPDGSLDHPVGAGARGLSGSELPGGGHGCGALRVDCELAPSAEDRFAFVLGVTDDPADAPALRRRYAGVDAVDGARAELERVWTKRTAVFQVHTSDPAMDRFVNVWNPLNCVVTLERTRDISTDHVGVDGMRFRDTMQDALAVANFDPPLAESRIRLVLAAQGSDGSGCFSFYPFAEPPRVNLEPHRCDNTVWPIFTIANLVAETGDLGFFEQPIAYREGGEGSVFDHVVAGLRWIAERRGPHGLPTLLHADWNDGLAVFKDERAESVMLGMQLVHATRLLREFARRLGHDAVADWCADIGGELKEILNSDVVWDGEWYRRLLLSDGTRVGASERREGRIYLEPQAWAVLSGVGDHADRGRTAMAAAHRLLDTPRGLMIHTPPYTGIPNPEDPLTSNVPGTGENGSIFCHANTWAVIADCHLGNADRAFDLYRRLLPAVASEEAGASHWGREPYAFVSSITGPARGADFGRAGISWLTGTASWMHIAATQHILGIQPTLDGLQVRPCLPTHLRNERVRVLRKFRGDTYEIELTDPPTITKS